MTLDSRCPSGPLEDRWAKHKAEVKLVGPINRRKYDIIVVGTGLAGASAAATLAEQGYRAGLGILRLDKQYGAERLEAAASRAMLTGLRRCRQMETLLRGGRDRLGTADLQPEPDPPAIEHGNVRGAGYYN